MEGGEALERGSHGELWLESGGTRDHSKILDGGDRAMMTGRQRPGDSDYLKRPGNDALPLYREALTLTTKRKNRLFEL